MLAGYFFCKNCVEVIIGVDVDGVLRNFVKSFNSYYNLEAKRKIPVDYQPKFYDEPFAGSDVYDREISEKVWRKYQYEIFRNAEMYGGALEFVRRLSLAGEVVFITCQRSKAGRVATKEWLEEKGFLKFGGVVFACVDRWRLCDVLVDDYIVNLEEAKNGGVKVFCVKRRWNEGFPERLDYNEIVEKICSLGLVEKAG